jgi:hypothetical protein
LSFNQQKKKRSNAGLIDAAPPGRFALQTTFVSKNGSKFWTIVQSHEGLPAVYAG